MAEILIIGGGVAGLSAGIYAQLNGHHATICERQNVMGGNLTGWQRGDYHIDNCIHWLTGTNPKTKLYQIWKDLGALGGVKIFQPDALYTYEEDGVKVVLYSNLEKIEKKFLEIAPEDEKEIKNFLKAVRYIQKITNIAEKSGQNKSFFREIQAISLLYGYYKISTGELALRFKNPHIQGFITSMLGKEFAALALIIIFANFCGGNGGIPAGSSLAMANRITKRFLTLGGTLLKNKEAVQISEGETGAQIVSFADGSMLTADYVIATTEPTAVFEKLLSIKMPKRFVKLYNNPKMPRFSSIQCAFACRTDKLPFYGDFIFRLPKMEGKLLSTENLIIREFSHEKGFAPNGHTVIQSLIFCDESVCREYIRLRKNPLKYRAKKAEIAETIKDCIEKKFPQLRDKLSVLDVWTPATYRRYTNAEVGSYMSFLFPSKTLPKRLNNHIKEKPRVILASQWLQSPGGLPIAAQVGKDAITRITKIEKRRKKVRG